MVTSSPGWVCLITLLRASYQTLVFRLIESADGLPFDDFTECEGRETPATFADGSLSPDMPRRKAEEAWHTKRCRASAEQVQTVEVDHER